jgi:Xaa-Pro aminopeptidase
MREVRWPYGWGRVGYAWEEREPWLQLPFPIAEYEGRVDRLRRGMRARGLDGLLVHGNRAERAPIRYLTNFEDYYGGDTLLVIPASGPVGLTTNAVMHGEPMHSGAQDTWVRDLRCAPHPRTVDSPTTTINDHLHDLLAERGLTRGRLGVCGEYAYPAREFLRTQFPKLEQVEAAALVGETMMRKSDAEVALMKAVARVSDAGLIAFMNAAKPEVSEHDLAAEANYAFFKAGAEDTAFPIAACGGPRSGFKHVVPSPRKLEAGEIVFTDMGARYQGYCSDTARGKVVGDDPTAEQRRFLDAQLAIVHETIAMIKPGVRIGDLAERAARLAKELGYEEWFYFRGHGIGAATHIPPSFVPGSQAVLEPNLTFAYEPMLVRKGFGTACVEDLYVVTATGCARLSEAPEKWWG